MPRPWQSHLASLHQRWQEAESDSLAQRWQEAESDSLAQQLARCLHLVGVAVSWGRGSRVLMGGRVAEVSGGTGLQPHPLMAPPLPLPTAPPGPAV